MTPGSPLPRFSCRKRVHTTEIRAAVWPRKVTRLATPPHSLGQPLREVGIGFMTEASSRLSPGNHH
jgi:hypothetical protein